MFNFLISDLPFSIVHPTMGYPKYPLKKEIQMEDLQKQLDLAMAALDKTYGKNTVIKLGHNHAEQWPSISTGALTLDLALGIGGLPRGRIIEIYGPESSGKTTVALSVIAEAQANGMRCAFLDTEHALDPSYSKMLGVDLDELIFSQPDYAEQALEVMDGLLRSNALDVIVLDSVAALVPKAELEGDMGQSHMGLQARLMGQALRKMVAIASQNKTMLIFINQIREKIGVMFGSPETTPGGRALKFYSSVRLDVRKIATVKNKTTGDVEGVEVKANIVKNKMGPPYRIANFEIVYGKGINNLGCIFDLAVDKGIFEKSGTWFKYNGEIFAQGKAKAIEALASDMELTAQIKKEIIDGPSVELLPEV